MAFFHKLHVFAHALVLLALTLTGCKKENCEVRVLDPATAAAGDTAVGSTDGALQCASDSPSPPSTLPHCWGISEFNIVKISSLGANKLDLEVTDRFSQFKAYSCKNASFTTVGATLTVDWVSGGEGCAQPADVVPSTNLKYCVGTDGSDAIEFSMDIDKIAMHSTMAYRTMDCTTTTTTTSLPSMVYKCNFKAGRECCFNGEKPLWHGSVNLGNIKGCDDEDIYYARHGLVCGDPRPPYVPSSELYDGAMPELSIGGGGGSFSLFGASSVFLSFVAAAVIGIAWRRRTPAANGETDDLE